MRRSLLPILILSGGLVGCAGEMQGKWPSLAHRAGEIAGEGPAVKGRCAGCELDGVAAPAVVAPALQPLPADALARLTSITGVIAGVEAKSPAQARTATAAIAAAQRDRGCDSGQSGDAEIERSRYEALFMPLSIEARRLEVLSDDVVGRDGAEAVLARIADLQSRLAALEQKRTALPD